MDEGLHPNPTPPEERKRTLVVRGRATVAQAKGRAEELRSRAEALRPASVPLDVAMGSYEHDTKVGGGILAGAVAFRIFLFIVPFVFFLVVAFGLAADVAGKSPRQLASDAGIAGLVASTIDATGDTTFWSRMSILAVSGFAMLLGARTLVKVLNIVHVLVWRLPHSRLRRPVSAIAGTIFSVALGMALVHGAARLRDSSVPAWILGELLFILFPFGIWLVASMRLFPHPAGASWRDFVPGAALVALGIELLQVFTAVWITRSFERRSETFGAIGGSLSLLLWAYVIGRILTTAVVLNAVTWRRIHPESTRSAPEPMSLELPSLPSLQSLPSLPPPSLQPPSLPPLPPPG